MEQSRRGGRIADPVHGYVHFTGIERAILDHPVAQRLRYISQNGLAHLVFPEVRTSRFSHSLGTMHLSSEFLAACLRNTDSESRKKLGEAIGKAICQVAGQVSDPLDAAKELPSEALLAANYCYPDHRPYLVLAEQGLRLAALFHDLGHLPFSHDFENSIEEYWLELPDANKQASPFEKLVEQSPGQLKIHERLGHELALMLFRVLFGDLKNTPVGEAARISFEFGQHILEESVMTKDPEPGDAAVQWLHTLIDGELDVDRCDYILRDGRNHGFEFAAYDLTRLIDNLLVACKDRSFILAVKPHGLSAVESFLLSRFRSYQYGIRHHKVAQVGAALRYSISRILQETVGHIERITNFAEDLRQIVVSSALSKEDQNGLLKRFAQYDDVWWSQVMREQCQLKPDEWLELVCWRKSGPRSLWKRAGEFPGDLTKWNEALPELKNLEAQLRWSEAVRSLKQEGVLIVRHYFTAWEADPSTKESLLAIQQDHDKFEPVSRLSPLVRGLQQAWMNDVQVQAFLKPGSKVSKEEVVRRLEVAMGG